MHKRKLLVMLLALSSAAIGVFVFAQEASRPSANSAVQAFDQSITKNSQNMIDEGRQIFRFDTFGDEAFWGDALKLHKAIAGANHGGVGPGVSPKTALSVGLKVDADALPPELIHCMIREKAFHAGSNSRL